MRIESIITRTLSIVDRALRKEFPGDYDKRCLYGAFATCALLQDQGFDANLVGGDFLAFVVAVSGERAGLQGFGFGRDQPSHFWVEVQDTIVDLGPHYLPRSSSFPAVGMPLIAWQPATKLPKFLRYRRHMRCSCNPMPQFSRGKNNSYLSAGLGTGRRSASRSSLAGCSPAPMPY